VKYLPDKFGKPNPINEFFDNEFIQFANYDNVISIPDVMDGLKVSQRKILYSALKKNLKTEVKVAQFGASTSELTHYNHGEGNMFGTIVNMAQDFVGANNINLFHPAGQFGSRRDPKASASPRYIYTHLTDITRLIFRKEDDEILNYLDEDGEQIEPDFYLPIIPMILVNGTSGIGTGWSTDIPMYDPLSLIQVIKRKIIKPDQKYMINPSFRNWNGEIDYLEDKNTYKTYGIYTLDNTKKTVKVTELPIGISTDKYISNLDKLIDDKKIKTFIDNSTDEKIDITITLEKIVPNLHDYLKLTNNVSINNMHTWFNGEITKWETAEHLLNTWIDERVKYYTIRKDQWTAHLETQFIKFANLFKFIDDVINGVIIINNRKLKDILIDMEGLYDKYNDGFDYLLSLPTYAFTEEKYEYYKNQAKAMKKELNRYKSLKLEDIWNEELEELETYLDKNY
jgi:DNA topoisomerase II